MILQSQVLTLKTRTFKILAFCVLIAASFALYPQIKHLSQFITFSSSGPIFSEPKEKDQKFAKAEIFNQVIRYLKKNYYDTNSLKANKLLKEALHGISRNVPEIVVKFPERGNRFTVEVNGQRKRFSPPNLSSPEDMVPIIQEVFDFIQKNYHGETKFSDMEYAAINGMLKSLDPHSSLLPPKIFSEFKTQTEGEFGGIGIVIGLKEGELTVISPLPDTPADRAGLRSKDKIVKIEDEASINMNLTEAVERLRGKVGTKVNITLEREGAPAPIQVTLTRAKIKIESVQSKLLPYPDGNIGIIRVKSFQEETLRELNRHLQALKQSKKFKGLILDLRNNPGGLLNQAVDMADLFLKEGTIVFTVGAKDQILEINRAHSSDADEDYPMVILVNEGSASASEIVAGAIKKNNRGVVIGNPTFGKGSVQSVYSLKDGSALKITVAQYLTPGKASIQSIGITPDIKFTPMRVEEKRVDIVESETFGEKDLEKHLDSSLAQKEKPIYTLEYHLPKFPDPEDDSSNTYSRDIKVEDDFQLKFAEQILRHSHSKDRKAILSEIKGLIEDTRKKESTKVTQALKDIGVQWTLSPIKKGKPVASVTFNIHSSAGQVLKAGEEVQLELKVKNVGESPFHQLIAVTESKHFLLKNREFIFGKINPGETKTWKVPLKIPASAFRREDNVVFSFKEGNGFVPENFQSVLITEPLNRPSYAYRMEVHDEGRYGSKGNGNHKADLGEKIVLKLNVENQGSGESRDTIVNLKNLEGKGIFISQGRNKLKSLKSNESKEAKLSFVVDPKFSKEEAKLELIILDNESQEVLRDKITFPIGSKTEINDKMVQAGPRLTLKQHPFPTKTKQREISISGKVKDPSGLKDLSVFVGDNKAYLKTFSTKRDPFSIKESSFLAPIPLEEKENNLITILVRDQDNLITRRSFYIYQE